MPPLCGDRMQPSHHDHSFIALIDPHCTMQSILDTVITLYILYQHIMDEDIHKMKVPQLKQFLKKRGIPTDHNRPELVKIAQQAAKMINFYPVMEACDHVASLTKRR